MTDYLFLGNEATLDFVNTEVMTQGTRIDLLQDFESLTGWLEKSGLVSAASLRRLAARWKKTKEGETALRDARELREVLRAGLEKIAATGHAPAALAEALRRWLREPRSTTDIRVSEGRIQMMTHPMIEQPEDMIVLLAQTAAKFLSTADYSAIRGCEGAGCILFFYDTSKNHSRRWCSMELCGNRAKVAAFRERA